MILSGFLASTEYSVFSSWLKPQPLPCCFGFSINSPDDSLPSGICPPLTNSCMSGTLLKIFRFLICLKKISKVMVNKGKRKHMADCTGAAQARFTQGNCNTGVASVCFVTGNKLCSCGSWCGKVAMIHGCVPSSQPQSRREGKRATGEKGWRRRFLSVSCLMLLTWVPRSCF